MTDHPALDAPPGAGNGGTPGGYLENAPAALAVVSADDTVLFANAAFRRLVAPAGEVVVGRPAREVFSSHTSVPVSALLARVRNEGVSAQGEIALVSGDGAAWTCTVWPGASAEQVVLQLAEPNEPADMSVRRRVIAERLVLSALREQGLAEIAEAARRRAMFLAEASRSLSESIERETTFETIARLSLLTSAAWCVVDIVESDQVFRRLSILHNDPEKLPLTRELDGRWLPEPQDPIGAPLALRVRRTVIIDKDLASVIAAASHSPENLQTLQRLSIGSLLVVPLMHADALLGAITFVCGTENSSFTPDDVEVAERLGAHCALALHNSNLYALATGARARAEIARSKARASLLEAEKVSIEKTDLLNNMSHELRTPLNAIAGYTELLVDGIYGPLAEAQIEPIRRIQKSEEHLVHLINGVLAFASGESGIDRFQDVPLAELIDEITPMLVPQMRRKGITLELVPQVTSAAARSDRQRLKQIMLNIIGNAIKFTSRGGSITVSVIDSAAVPGFIDLVVRDTGIGIQPEKLAEIFDPFVQVHDVTVIHERGSGLGLSISRDLARKMGGDITAESVFGVGSVFTVTLPRANA